MSSMPLPSVRQQVLNLKVSELQEVCRRIGINKTGRKAILQGRILAYLGETPVDLAYQLPSQSPVKEQWKLEKAYSAVRLVFCEAHPGLYAHPTSQAMALPNIDSSAEPARGLNNVTTYMTPLRDGQQGGSNVVRCICNAAHSRDVVQCQDCGIWQHRPCLGLSPMLPDPPNFHCEQCRVRLTDPFWEAVEPAVIPAFKLMPAIGRPPVMDQYGIHQVQIAETTFYLTQHHLDEARRNPQNSRIQIACMLINDEVQFRIHWPRNIEFRINSMHYRPYNRNVSTKMGINQRDAAASVATLCLPSRNTASFSMADSGTFVIVVQRGRYRGLAGVKSLMAAPESKEAAIERVKRQVGGEEGDDGIMVSHHVVSLKDPMSGQRMTCAARFSDASGLQAFDLDSFLSMVERNRKWQDPTTLQNSTIKQLQVDTYMQRVLECTASHPHLTDIEISAEGLWRPDGSTGTWWSISQSPVEVNLEENLATGAPKGPKRNAPADEGVVLSDSETDEEEELRQAALAVRRTTPATLTGAKRQREDEVEVIDLISSDDDDNPPLLERQLERQLRQRYEQQQQHQQQQRQGSLTPTASPRPGSAGRPTVADLRAAADGHIDGDATVRSPLRIRLPERATRVAQAQAQQTMAAAATGAAAPRPVAMAAQTIRPAAAVAYRSGPRIMQTHRPYNPPAAPPVAVNTMFPGPRPAHNPPPVVKNVVMPAGPSGPGMVPLQTGGAAQPRPQHPSVPGGNPGQAWDGRQPVTGPGGFSSPPRPLSGPGISPSPSPNPANPIIRGSAAGSGGGSSSLPGSQGPSSQHMGGGNLPDASQMSEEAYREVMAVRSLLAENPDLDRQVMNYLAD